jgi:malate dehydrogenase (oxaloacetate-decarboxylating)(NADP+)
MVRLITTDQNRSQTNCFCGSRSFDVLKAAQIVWEEGIGFPILLGIKKLLNEKRGNWF